MKFSLIIVISDKLQVSVFSYVINKMVQVLRLTLANLEKYCPKRAKDPEDEKSDQWSDQNNSDQSDESQDNANRKGKAKKST